MIRLNDTTGEDTARTTRRSLLWLGHVAVVGGAPGLWRSSAKAGRKKKCRRRCNSEQKCVRGKCEWIRRP
jgi:hypothetical protein